MTATLITAADITTKRVNRDANGNPRIVVHFLAFNTQEELDKSGSEWIPVREKFNLALARAHKLGGRAYRGKDFGGGIVFQAYSDAEIVDIVNRALENA